MPTASVTNQPRTLGLRDPSTPLFVVASIVLTRTALMLVGVAAMSLLPIGARHLELLPRFPALEMWAQWDAQHYVDVAVRGYDAPTQSFSNIAFYPLYPLLIRVGMLFLGRIDHETGALVGLVIANVALFVALVYLSALVARDLSLSIARRTVAYVLVFPTTLFLSSVYAESLFLATSVASLYHARRGEWYRAGVGGLLAALTRPFGLFLAVPIAIELWRQRAPVRSWPAVLLPGVGLAVYIGYLWLLFGDPLAYLAANRSWGRGFHWPWETLLGYIRGPLTMFDWTYAWIDLVSVVAVATVLFVGWRRVPLSYAAYSAVALLFALSTGIAWFSAARHALALFPVLVILASFGVRREFNWAWLALSVLLAGAFMARVAVGYWVT